MTFWEKGKAFQTNLEHFQNQIWCEHPGSGKCPLCCSPQLRCVLHPLMGISSIPILYPLSEVSCVCKKIALHEMGEEVEQSDESLKIFAEFLGHHYWFSLRKPVFDAHICVGCTRSLYIGCPTRAQLRSDLGSDPSRGCRDLLCHWVSQSSPAARSCFLTQPKCTQGVWDCVSFIHGANAFF